jgi:hypothetical protein
MSMKCCRELSVSNCVMFVFCVSLLFANDDVCSDILPVG